MVLIRPIPFDKLPPIILPSGAGYNGEFAFHKRDVWLVKDFAGQNVTVVIGLNKWSTGQMRCNFNTDPLHTHTHELQMSLDSTQISV